MKILTIGDVHGLSSWKILTHGGYTEYYLWRTSVESSGGIDTSDVWDLPFSNYDKIIFIGDYVDSYDCSNVTIKHNLLDIIHFKQILREKVVLLWGNHDIQYIVPNQVCSGYRSSMQHDLSMIFRENFELFTMCYELNFSGSHYLWTHAGVSSGWFKEINKDLFNPNYRFYEVVKERNPQSISEIINLAWEMKHVTLFNVDAYSGGSSLWAGPLWVRPKILNAHPLRGINQIVGHTSTKKIETFSHEDFTHHWYVDVLNSVTEGLETQIENEVSK